MPNVTQISHPMNHGFPSYGRAPSCAILFFTCLGVAATTVACGTACPDGWRKEGNLCVPVSLDAEVDGGDAADASDAAQDAPIDVCDSCGDGSVCFENACVPQDRCTATADVPCEAAAPRVLRAPDAQLSTRLGVAVALNADGTVLAAGADLAPAPDGAGGQVPDAGAVYIFTRSGFVWSHQTTVYSPEPDGGDDFGQQVALSASGDVLVVGVPDEDGRRIADGGSPSDDMLDTAGAVFVYRRVNNIWQAGGSYLKALDAARGDRFGGSVSLDDSGTVLAVGAQGADAGAGRAYIFEESGGIWSQQETFQANEKDNNDRFSVVALSGDGLTLAVGAPFEDSAASGVGQNSADDTRLQSGAAYVFRETGGAWGGETYLKASASTVDALFGSALALNGDGTLLVVGEPGAAALVGGSAESEVGQGYVFEESGGTWSERQAVFPTEPRPGAETGAAVALSRAGRRLALGAQRDDHNGSGFSPTPGSTGEIDAGAVFLFATDAGSMWTRGTFVKADVAQGNASFGRALALSGDGRFLAVGAPEDDGGISDPSNSGAVYVYRVAP